MINYTILGGLLKETQRGDSGTFRGFAAGGAEISRGRRVDLFRGNPVLFSNLRTEGNGTHAGFALKEPPEIG